MEAYQIVAGFSDIKEFLRTKTRTQKSLTELQLWFSFENDVIYVHDYFEHKTSAALAVYSADQNLWTVYLEKNFGERLIRRVIYTTPNKEINGTLNRLYDLHGFIPFGPS